MMIPAILVLLLAALAAADVTGTAGTTEKDQISTSPPYPSKIQRLTLTRRCGLDKNCWLYKLTSTTPQPKSQKKSLLRMVREILHNTEPRFTQGFVKPHWGFKRSTTPKPSATTPQPNGEETRSHRKSALRTTREIRHEAVNGSEKMYRHHSKSTITPPYSNGRIACGIDHNSTSKSTGSGRPQNQVQVQRILGGRKASIIDFPSMLSMWVYKGNNLTYQCGAIILNDFWALTAAHCVMDSAPSQTILRAGSYSKSNRSSDHTSEKFIVHEQFTLKEGQNFVLKDDIALVKVKQRFPLNNRTVKYARLPRPGMLIAPGTTATAVGWAETGSNSTELLQAADLKIISKDVCADVWYKQNAKLSKNSILCTQDSSKRFCGGSSGSPLFLNGEVVGVASAHLDVCIKTDLPGVHTDVPYYREWIRKKTGF